MSSAEKKKCHTLDLTNIPVGTSLTIGRSSDCDLVIDNPDISAKHVKISLTPEGAFIRDLQSRKGAVVNKRKLRGLTRLNQLDKLKIGGQTILIRLPDQLCASGCRLNLENVSAKVGRAGAEKTILNRVSLEVSPGEFVGIVGPSGCGKSTLMNIVSGSAKPSSGRVMLNRQEMSSKLLREKVGCLPQSVIIHDRLTCAEILNYARQLHRGTGNPAPAIAQSGLNGRENQLIKTLSGGQQKRAGLSQELLFSPELLCLDEVTSGLDPLSEQEMMVLFRNLCNQGKTILCITHYPERLVLCDKLAVLLDGNLIFFGSPMDAMKHFSIASLDQLYSHLGRHDTAYWIDKFKSITVPPKTTEMQLPDGITDVSTRHGSINPFEQLLPLIGRNIRLWLRSPGELIFLMLQGIFIGLLIGLCFGKRAGNLTDGELSGRSSQLVFALMLSAIWTGATSSVREIVKERKILIHEGRKKLSVIACILSKLLVLGAISCLGTLLVESIVILWTGLKVDMSSLTVTLLVTSMVSTALGLMVSALCSSQEKALTALPILIIGLVMFSGGIYELKGFSLKAAEKCSYSYWALNAARHSIPPKILNAEVLIIPKEPGRHNRMQRVLEKPRNRNQSIFIATVFGVVFLAVAAMGLKYTITKG